MPTVESRVAIRPGAGERHALPLTLMGQNLEVAGGTAEGLLADRLRNPKFLGPANPQTGIAPHWRSYPDVMHWNWRCELTPGMGHSGETAQMLCMYDPVMGKGLVQTGVWVREGETLEVEIWALAQSKPTKLEVGIRANVPKLPPYDQVEIVIDKPYWAPYRATLRCPKRDDNAEFFMRMRSLTLVWLDQVHLRPQGQFLRQDVLQAIHHLRPAVVRYPGGCECTSFRWRHSIGPVHTRPHTHDPVFKQHINYDYGTDEFLELCHELKATPHISVTIGNGTPDDAADWGAYCRDWHQRRGIEPPMMYWHMGNEHNGAWEIGHMDGETYAQVLAAYVPGVRKAYPNSRIIAIGSEFCYVGGQKPWRAVILEKAAEHFDVLGLQLYGAADPTATVLGATVDPRQLLKSVCASVRERLLPTVRATIDAGQSVTPAKTVAITEWNLWTHCRQYHDVVASHEEPADGAHLMFVALLQHGLFSLGQGMELVEYYGMLNAMGVIQATGPEVRFSAVGEFLRLWREVMPAEFLPLETSDSDTLDAVCVGAQERRWLFVVNTDAQRPQRVNLEHLGLPQEMRTIQAPDVDALAVVHAPQSLHGKQQIELPPLSVSRIELA